MTSLNQSTLLALLEEHPYAAADLAALIGIALSTVLRELRVLQRAGTVKRVGAAWALSGYVEAPLVEEAEAAVEIDEDADSLEDVIDVDSADESDAIEELEPPRRRPGRAVRQAPHRPTTITMQPGSASTSWWVGRDRAAFQQSAETELDRMTKSKHARLVPARTLP